MLLGFGSEGKAFVVPTDTATQNLPLVGRFFVWPVISVCGIWERIA
jgi:hypothetical protein